MDRRDCHESELLDDRPRHGAGAAPFLRHSLRRRVDDAGGVRCRVPGVPSLDILGNVVPFIGGEEEKMQSETLKILAPTAEGRRTRR